MRKIKQNTARNIMVWLADSTDHVAGKTSATLAVSISKNGAAFASISPTIVERGNGWYSVALAVGDTDTLGDLALRATATGADSCDMLIEVIAYDPQSAIGLGLSRLDANISSRSTYDGSDTSGTATLLTRLTSTRAGLLDNLDAAISTRSTYAGADSSGVTTLLTRVDATLTTTVAASGWTTNEKAQTRFRLGLDGSSSTPTANPNLSTLTAAGVWANTDRTITGEVTVASGSKTGYKLASDGLDQITATEPNGVATTFPGRLMQLWSRFFRRTRRTASALETYRADGTTVNTTQTWSQSGSTQDVGAAT